MQPRLSPGMMRRLLIGFGLTAVLAAGGLTVRAATGGGGGSGGGDNAAVAVNTKDGSERYRLSFRITRANGEHVDASNAAVAYSSCTDCRTVAIAIQAVIVWGDAEVVSPTNLAIAVNEICSLCETYADGRQHVIGTDGVPRLSADANRRIAQIRRELQALRRDDLTIDEIRARVDALSAALAQILADEFTTGGQAGASGPSGPSGSAEPSERTPAPVRTPRPSTGDSPTPTASPTPTTSPGPTASPSPSA